MHSTAAIGGLLDPQSATARRSRDLGLVCQFAAKLAAHAQAPLGELMRLWQGARNVGQLKVYVNGYDECVGYVAWAFLSPDVESRFIAGDFRPLEDWEFNDGTSPWILDMAVAPGSLAYVLEDLRDVVLGEYRELTYFRLRDGQRICKRVSRDDATSFMAAGRLRGRA